MTIDQTKAYMFEDAGGNRYVYVPGSAIGRHDGISIAPAYKSRRKQGHETYVVRPGTDRHVEDVINGTALSTGITYTYVRNFLVPDFIAKLAEDAMLGNTTLDDTHEHYGALRDIFHPVKKD